MPTASMTQWVLARLVEAHDDDPLGAKLARSQHSEQAEGACPTRPRRREGAGSGRRSEVRAFQVSHRAKVTPGQVGLPAGHNRRVPGLRRTEVAALAGMSVEYYPKIERGALTGASEQVLDAIARALLLDDAERAHLAHIARPIDGLLALARRSRRGAVGRAHTDSPGWRHITFDTPGSRVSPSPTA